MIILLIVTLIFLIVSDFRSRSVYIWQIILFFVAQLLYCFLSVDRLTIIHNVVTNTVFLVFLSLCIGIYVFIRFRDKKRMIGWGDILFVFALTPYFTLHKFLIFMIISLVLSLTGWGVCYLMGRRSKEIPLVSTVGICYCFLLIYDNIMTTWI